jgi:hypothetical protein
MHVDRLSKPNLKHMMPTIKRRMFLWTRVWPHIRDGQSTGRGTTAKHSLISIK